MIISAKWVTARKSHKCNRYEIPPDGPCSLTIRPGDGYLRLYGAADGDPPYVMRLCETCADRAMSYWPDLGAKLERGKSA